MNRLRHVIAVLLLLVVNATGVRATSHYVKPDGTGDFPTIQAAVNAASVGDTILLAPGTFTGAANREVTITVSNLVITSQVGAAGTIIDCQSAGRAFRFIVGSAELSRVTIKNGFTCCYGGAVYIDGSPTIKDNVFLVNRTQDSGGAIHVNSGSPLIDGNIFKSGQALHGGAVTVLDSSIVTNNRFEGNTAVRSGGAVRCESNSIVQGNLFAENKVTQGDGGGLFLWGASLTLLSNTFAYNKAAKGAAAYMAAGSIVSIERSIISRNSSTIHCADSSMVTTSCSVIWANTDGDILCGADGGNNQVVSPQFCPTDYTVSVTSPCTPGNSPCGQLIGALPVSCSVTGIGEDAVPALLSLSSGTPNPFNRSTTIRYELAAGLERASIRIYDTRGALVRSLAEGHLSLRGSLTWDGRTDAGQPVPSGVYFCSLRAGGYDRTIKMILLR